MLMTVSTFEITC